MHSESPSTQPATASPTDSVGARARRWLAGRPSRGVGLGLALAAAAILIFLAGVGVGRHTAFYRGGYGRPGYFQPAPRGGRGMLRSGYYPRRAPYSGTPSPSASPGPAA